MLMFQTHIHWYTGHINYTHEVFTVDGSNWCDCFVSVGNAQGPDWSVLFTIRLGQESRTNIGVARITAAIVEFGVLWLPNILYSWVCFSLFPTAQVELVWYITSGSLHMRRSMKYVNNMTWTRKQFLYIHWHWTTSLIVSIETTKAQADWNSVRQTTDQTKNDHEPNKSFNADKTGEVCGRIIPAHPSVLAAHHEWQQASFLPAQEHKQRYITMQLYSVLSSSPV